VSVVVSDTSPLHYLILCGAGTARPRLFSQVVIPPTVFRELQQPNTPARTRMGELAAEVGYRANAQGNQTEAVSRKKAH
jgi:predicted nucleic acid-binding protein